MKRFASAFISVVAAFLAGVLYLAIFNDEINPNHALNQQGGPFAPMYRHFLEYCIIVATTWPAVALGFYWAFGTFSEAEIMRHACRRFFILHCVSGGLILAGLFISAANGQPIHFRDSLTAVIGISILLLGVVERVWNQQLIEAVD
jgi:hypothetical protein